ncbi:hypothetical protein ACQP1P_38515 [Dactylosporangium sp. CA-052675]|uniref:hypothetical protein n=1 Tax=Dactylosporangium sp. CA-052675 TaxID=3239927 RepID=UPI003D929A56
MTPDTEQPFQLGQMAPPRRRTGMIGGIAAGAVVLVGATIAITLMASRSSAPSAPTSDATPVVNGISRPDSTCVTTDGTDHQDYWNGNGWWAGRVDGEPKEMPALNVLSLKLGGHQISNAWICAPR